MRSHELRPVKWHPILSSYPVLQKAESFPLITVIFTSIRQPPLLNGHGHP